MMDEDREVLNIIDQNTRLTVALRALVVEDDPAFMRGDQWQCPYCLRYSATDTPAHFDDCPVAVGRKVLSELGEGMSSDIDRLRHICDLANRAAFAELDCRATCITTSAALRDVLWALGVDARLMRVETAVHGHAPIGTILGSFGDGSRRGPTEPGKWRGHLTVVAADRFLLDPTLDQVEGMRPFVGEVSTEFLIGRCALRWTLDHEPTADFARPHIRYKAFPDKGGWKNTPAFRVSWRRPIVLKVLADLDG